ncbi:radical SAM/SPASM domain-containing protein [Geoalkalibacter halelectricus]|uniref:Radical SAM protein n=1 Tax=Geoalkalibacter halelectricus TaxID=2847045 RepID=A0ABY5ZID1_9BACT|nr:radical SAM protein [Geoalkalibacter halelectricus]MDO3377261.1 radical SAM protein [Geoalkalibacter halelectricus]UWZ78900.1 radical SAM protein [Geoalkalibacter halelectricus]
MLAKLFCNGVRFRQLRRSGKPYRLQSLSLEVTHRCICRCDMCNIWKIPAEVADLELADWLAVLRSPALRHLRELDITGGEPFLRADLGELLQQIVALKPDSFPALRTLSITTNALLTERILNLVRASVGPLRECGIDLVLACGVDAAGKLHDRIRNFPGAWERFQQTLRGLQEIRTEHANLILGLKTTIVPLNVHELSRLADFADENGLFTIISPCILTPNRFANLDKVKDLRFSPADIGKLIDFYASPRFAWSGHREALLGYLKTGKMHKPCSAGYNTLFVRHNGEVFACPVLAESLGNVRTLSLDSLYRSEAANHFRKQVGAFPECGQCTEPGMERIAWPLEGFALLGFWAERGREDFDRLVRHMGLDKYI